ncbi:MAG: GNAT family N-acetyltransferase [Alphaproteobacteria bacterium]
MWKKNMDASGMEPAQATRDGSVNAASAKPATFSVTVYQRMQDVEHVWRELEHQAPATIYQRFDFLDAWQSTLGVAAGVKPHIVVVKKEGRVVALLPFGVGKCAKVPTLGFLGGKHSNINIALIHPDFYASMPPATVKEILREAISHDPAIAAVGLKNMPTVWDGLANPLALNGCTSAASNLWLLPLEKDFATLLERRRSGAKTAKGFRQKLNRLNNNFGTVEMIEAESFDQYAELIDTFLQQKLPWLEERGIKSDMTTPAFREFLLSLAERSQGRTDGVINIIGLKVGGKWVATCICASFQGCYSNYLTSLAADPVMNRSSPGELLQHKFLTRACETGHKIFEFGIGRTPQKERWLKAGEPMVDLYRPVSARGMLLVSGLKLAQQAKRTLKENPALMSAIKTVREKLGGRRYVSGNE